MSNDKNQGSGNEQYPYLFDIHYYTLLAEGGNTEDNLSIESCLRIIKSIMRGIGNIYPLLRYLEENKGTVTSLSGNDIVPTIANMFSHFRDAFDDIYDRIQAGNINNVYEISENIKIVHFSFTSFLNTMVRADEERIHLLGRMVDTRVSDPEELPPHQ